MKKKNQKYYERKYGRRKFKNAMQYLVAHMELLKRSESSKQAEYLKENLMPSLDDIIFTCKRYIVLRILDDSEKMELTINSILLKYRKFVEKDIERRSIETILEDLMNRGEVDRRMKPKSNEYIYEITEDGIDAIINPELYDFSPVVSNWIKSLRRRGYAD